MKKAFWKKKTKTSDFEESDLPSTRPALFWDVVKNEFRKLFGVSLLLLAFALPFLAARFFCDFYRYALVSQGAENVSWPSFLFLILNPIATAVFGVGLGGAFRIVKRLCYLEPVFFWEDFKLGVKQNGKQAVLFSFLIGLCFSGTYAIRLMNPNNLLFDIPVGIFALLLYPSLLFAFPIISIYTTRVGETMNLSARLYLKAFLKNLIPLIAFLAPFFFEFIPDLILKYIAILAFLFLISPFYLLAFFLYESYLLDRYVNKEKYPGLVDKGIHRKKND